MLQLYKSLVRPHIDYCTVAWSPYYVKDKVLLEKVQRRFTRMVPGMKEFDYPSRLKTLKLWSLEERRNRSDLIEVFKMYRGFSSIPFETFFQLDHDSRTRGHTAKLKKHRCNTELRRHFFSERIINRWNKLRQETISATSINSFKQHLDKERSTRMDLFLD